jgi:hypothetical protein
LRPASGTLWKIGSMASRGSPGKNICVMSRCANALPNSEKWMCAGRQPKAWFCQG